jgi:putative DNA primase/helicase
MENAILASVTLIRHDGGIYYYNGKTYMALKSDLELIELIRRENISASCFQTHSVRVFNDLYAYLRADPKLKPYDYEERVRKCRNYVVLNNGVLNAKKLELKSFGKKWLTFHSVNASWVENPNPRRFLKFLNDAAMGDSSIVRLTLEMIGYLLSSLNTAKVFFVIGTAGNSGKSTLASLIKYLLGDEFVMAVSPNNLSDRFSLGDSRGKTVDLAMDIPKGKLNAAAVSRIKSITGNDSIVIEAKYMRPESTVSNLRFLFGTNYPITLPREDDEDAFWKRMIIIPFMRVTPPNEIEVDLLDQLIAEKDDIVSLCLRHLHTVIRNNYTFSPCQRSEAMKKSWRRAEFSTASVYYSGTAALRLRENPKIPFTPLHYTENT